MSTHGKYRQGRWSAAVPPTSPHPAADPSALPAPLSPPPPPPHPQVVTRPSQADRGFFVPPTFTEYLWELPFEAVEAYVRETGRLDTALPRSGDKRADKDILIARFTDMAVSDFELRRTISNLSFQAVSSFVRLAFEFHGRLFLAMATGGQHKVVESLVPVGLVVRMEFGGRPAFVLPWEVLDYAVRELGRGRVSPRSLLAFLHVLNKENLLKLICRTGYKPAATKKAGIILEAYRRLTGRFEAELEAMEESRLILLRELFRSGGTTADDSRPESVPGGDNRPLMAWRSAVGFEREIFQTYWGYRAAESQDFTAALDLVARGFVVPIDDPAHTFVKRPALTEEAAPAVRAFFIREMEARAAALRKKLAAPSPAGPVVSYADRVLEDLLKLQVAVSMGLVVVNKTGTISSRSAKNLVRLLDVEEDYVLANLGSLGLVFDAGGGPARLKDGLHHPVEILRRATRGRPARKAAYAVLRELSGWLGRKALQAYLDNHPTAAPWLHAPAAEGAAFIDAAALVGGFELAGFLESAEDGRAVRLTGLADRLDAAELDPAWDVIKAAARPVRVQPNLEILVPLTAEPGLFENLAAFADLTVLDRMVHFSLTRASLIRGLDAGWTPDAILAWLERPEAKKRRKRSEAGEGTEKEGAGKDGAGAALPPTVREFVASIGRKKGEASVMPCQAIVRCEGIGVKERILALAGVEAAKLPGAEDAPYLAVFHPPPGELVALLKKKKIYAEFAMIAEEGEAESPEEAQNGKGAGRDEDGSAKKGGHPVAHLERALRESFRSGVKVRLGFHRGYRWRRTNLVTIIGLRRGRVFFLDRDGIAASLPLIAIDAVHTK